MLFKDQQSPAEIAETLGVSTSSVRRWIRLGRIQTVQSGGEILIPLYQEFIMDRIRKGPAPLKASYSPPELREYSRWHEALDELVWLLKVTYTPRELLKKRSFRVDSLFAAYIAKNRITNHRIRRSLRSATPRRWALVIDDLKRGWYNELAYATPVRPSTLGLSFNDVAKNLEASGARFAFPSWRIVTAYYSTYFFLRSVALQKQTGFRLSEHNAALRVFNDSVAGAIDGILWCFPFSISHSPSTAHSEIRKITKRYQHWRFAYARHPRHPRRSPVDCLKRLRRLFKRKWVKRGRSGAYGVFDFLHDLRVWVNYQEIDSMLSLWGGGYRAFLDMNLTVILFFIGGLAELSFIATRGSSAYVKHLQGVYDLLTENNLALEEEFTATPLFQRHAIYTELGIVTTPLRMKSRPNPHAISISKG